MLVSWECKIILSWICVICVGSALKMCDFNVKPSILSGGKHPKIDYMCEAGESSHDPDGIIQNLKCLKTNLSGIHVCIMKQCNITILSPETFHFKMFEPVRTISLRKNNISSLPESLFHSPTLKNLCILNLDFNQISYLFPRQFAHLPNLQVLGLSFNKLKQIESGLFASNRISELNLIGNELNTLPDDLMLGKISSTLKFLKLGRNKLTAIPNCLSTINITGDTSPVLEYLDVSHNQLRELPSDLFGSRLWLSLKDLHVGHNNISYIAPSLFHSLFLQSIELIDLSFNSLKSLPGNMLHSRNSATLFKIRMNYNKITFLPDNLFKGHFVINMLEIYLSFNEITVIPAHFFEHLENLNRIFLNNNKIKSITAEMLPNHYESLCILNISNNQISSIGDLVPKVLGNTNYDYTCSLDASKNNITVQETNFVLTNDNNFHIKGFLDLSNNNIRQFKVTSTKIYQDPMYFSVALNTAWLASTVNNTFNVRNLVEAAMNIDIKNINKAKIDNLQQTEIFRLRGLIQSFPYKYNCDCEMENYLNLLGHPDFKKAIEIASEYSYLLGNLRTNNLEYVFKHLKCGSPKHLNDKYLDDVSHLQCVNSTCTVNKKCICTYTPRNTTIRIDCTETNIENVPEIKQTSSKLEIYAGFNKVSEFPVLSADIVVQIKKLDLSHNLLKNIPISFFSNYSNLTDLNLAGNLLVTLPLDTEWKKINSLKFIKLAGNKFPCNCPDVQIKQTIRSLYKNIKDSDNIKCSAPQHLKYKVIYKLPDSLFGCFFINLTLILTLTLSFLLFALVLLFVAYVFRYYISLFLFIHCGWRFCYNYTKGKTLYDVFISYSAKDSDWVVEQLMKPLENLDPPYNVCLHERDFLIGVPICDNISKAIEGSKCTICVVSKNWLESDWCQFEFRVAHCLATVEKQIRLLVILKEEIPKDKISGDLKFYMRTFTYLDAAQPLFWSRLLNDLPKPDGDEVIEVGDDRDVIELV